MNGLAILNDEPALGGCFRNNLVTGPAAIVMAVADFDSFGEAIRPKLVREIAPRATASSGAPTRPSTLPSQETGLSSPVG